MTVTPSVLTIGLKRLVAYQGDIFDPLQFATDPNITTPNPELNHRNFFVATLIGDITTVNGEDAKGTYFGRTRVVNSTSTNPLPYQAIADVTRIAMREHFFEIMNKNSLPIGTIMSSGLGGGVAPPGTGSPANEEGNWAIMGGTGAYLGARGQVAGDASPSPASMTEEPSQRLSHPFPPEHDGLGTFYLHVIPADPPQIVTAAFGPLVFHMNNMPVTALMPAAANETLLLFASGLGATNPDVDLSLPFPASTSNVFPPSKLIVNVNGIPANVTSAVGVPGEVDVYKVVFNMPSTTMPPTMPLQLSAAWILGPRVNISVA